MNKLQIIDIYPTSIIDTHKGNISHIIESPVDHMIKSIEYNLSNIDDKLENDSIVREWLRYMPHIDELLGIKEYQADYDANDPDSHTCKLDSDFKKIETTLPAGQVLFHRGCWFADDNELVFTRYTSTTLDPNFARGEPNPRDIYIVIKIMSPDIKFYFFDPNVENGFAEAEVLIENEIKLIRKCSYKIKKRCNDEYETVFYTEAYRLEAIS